MSGEPILVFERVTKRFDGIVALDGVDLEVPEGAIVGLIGPNGAGKTTVFNLATGAYPSTSGDIRFAGRSIVGEKPYRIARRGIARTFQNIRLFRSMTVLENVLVGQRPERGWAGQLLPVGWAGRAARAAAAELLELVGLEEVRDRPAVTLAYGLQRRVEIARALAAAPRLLLLDEPVAGMDQDEAMALRELLLRLKARGLSILLIEHDMPFVMTLCDHLRVLDFGAVIAAGPPAAIRQDPAVLDAYLGEAADA